MTVYGGVFLFDLAEKSINGWENQLGYRGYIEVWKRGDSRITIEADEDAATEDAWEAWVGDDEIGGYEPIAFGTFDQCNQAAKDYMARH